MLTKPDINTIDPSVRDHIGTHSGSYSQFIKELYYLAIYDISKADIVYNDIPLSIGPASADGGNTSPEYYFRLPPKVHEVSEPFATSITMTQDGGKFIESQGSPMKEIRLSGTTGIRPHRNDSKTLKIFGIDTGSVVGQNIAEFVGVANSPNLFGIAASVINTFTKPSPWPKGEAIGHDDITFLRNMFRLYSWYKVNAENASDIVMLWRNIKDGDYWLVEPKEFRLSQNTSSPLTYEYNITLNTLTKWDYKVTLKPDSMAILRDLRNLYARVNQTAAVIKQSFLFIASRIDKFARLPKNISEFILGPMISVIQGAQAVKVSATRFSDVFTSNVKQLKDNLREYLNIAKDFFPAQAPELNALRKAYRSVFVLLSNSDLSSSNISAAANTVKNDISNLYKNSNTGVSNLSPGFTGNSAFIGNQNIGSDTAQEIVKNGDDIKALAYRLLGDRTKFHILVVLNNLEPPYISEQGGVGVLKPGDRILYPKTTSSGLNLVHTSNPSNKDTLSSTSNNSVEQQYGRDLKLVPTENGTFSTLYDLSINQSGDLNTVVGIDNIVQAITIKFNTKRGELPSHPVFGALFPIGTKATPQTMAGFRINVEQTILSDLRVDSIQQLNFSSSGDVLSVSAKINIVNYFSSLRLNFPLRDL